MDPVDRDRLEAAKARSLGQHLLRCARLLDALAVERVRQQTGLPIRTAHTALVPHIDLDGTRPTEIARRLGVTKQAVAPLLDELEQMGLIERVPDPRDRRARLVRFAGPDGMLHGLGVLGQLERELACALGEDRVAALFDGLVALEAELERRSVELQSDR